MSDTEQEINEKIGQQMEKNQDEKMPELQPQKDGQTSQSSTGLREIAVGNRWTSYVLIIIGLMALMFSISALAKCWVAGEADKLTEKFSIPAATDCKTISDTDRKTLIKRQQEEIIQYAEGHRENAKKFYGYYYSTTAVVVFFGVLAFITFGIIFYQKGENGGISPHLITVFVVSAGIATAYQGFFGNFQQKANMDNNARLYSAYSKLLTKIDTYCTTGKITITDPSPIFLARVAEVKTPIPTPATSPTPTPTPATKPTSFFITLETDEFLNYVGWHLEQNKSLSIALDDKVAPIPRDASSFPFL